jgi:hypothetical protein
MKGVPVDVTQPREPPLVTPELLDVTQRGSSGCLAYWGSDKSLGGSGCPGLSMGLGSFRPESLQFLAYTKTELIRRVRSRAIEVSLGFIGSICV